MPAEAHAQVTYTNVYQVHGVAAILTDSIIDQIDRHNLKAGYLVEGCNVDSFLQGFSTSVSGYWPLAPLPGVGGVGPAGGVTWNGSGTGVEGGIGVGAGHDLSVSTGYNWRLL